MGDGCPRSHGYLEMIYHPLLYKTKMCESFQRNGVCHKKGVYCAKAHKETEIRSLVKIFGWNWKRHYDLSLRKSSNRSTKKSVSTADKSVDHKEVNSYNPEIILKYLEGFPSELSVIFRKLALKELSGQVGTKSNMDKNRSCIDNHISESGSLLSDSPMSETFNNIYDQISDMLLDDGL